MTAMSDLAAGAKPGLHPLDLWLARQCGAANLRDLPRLLAAAQAQALRRTLRHAAARSVFYAARLQGCNLDLATAADLARLPFTTAEDLRRWTDFLCVSQGDVRRMVRRAVSRVELAPGHSGSGYRAPDLGPVFVPDQTQAAGLYTLMCRLI